MSENRIKEEADRLLKEADSLLQLKQADRSLKIFESALKKYQQINDRNCIAKVFDRKGLVYYQQHRFKKARSEWEKALELYSEIGEKRLQSNAHFNIGLTYDKLNVYTYALKQYQDALEIYEELSDPSSIAIVLNNIGNVYRACSDYQKAMEFYERSLSISKKNEDLINECMCLINIGNYHNERSDYQFALEFYKKSLKIAKKLENPKFEAGNLAGIGKIHEDQSNHIVALEFYKNSLVIYRGINDRLNEAKLLSNIGLVYLALSDFSRAIEFHENSLNISREIGDKENKAANLGNIGLAYYMLSDYQKSLQYHKNSMKTSRDIGNKRGETISLSNIGNVYSDLSNYKQSVKYHKKSLELSKQSGDQRGEAISYLNIGFSYMNLLNFSQAFINYEKCLGLSRMLGDRSSESITLSYMGELNTKQKKYIEAEKNIRMGLKIALDLKTEREMLTAYRAHANCYFDQKLYDKEIEYRKKSIDTVEQVLSKLKLDSHKRSYTDGVYKDYEDIIVALLRLDKNKEAYNYVERSRARAYLDLLAGNQVRISKGKNQELFQKLRELMNLETQVDSKKGSESSDSLEEKRDKMRGMVTELTKEIKNQDPDLASMISVDPLNLNEVQELLKEDQTLLEYYITEEKLLIWVVTRNKFDVVQVPKHAKQIEEMVSNLNTEIKGGYSSKTSKELYKLLIESIEDKITGRNLIIVSHGFLHYLPFYALEDKNGEYLIKKDYIIRYIPSASTIKYLIDNRQNNGNTLLALGAPETNMHPLPYAETEVKEISKLFPPDKQKVLIGKNATKTKFIYLAESFDFIHLACHSVLDSGTPLYSSMILADDENVKGRLTVFDLFNMNIKADVVLSGCRTARGHQTRGDELVGLSRAFIFAGSPSLIASLWMVNDEKTAFLMKQYYKHLSVYSKAEAIKKAQLKTLKRYKDRFYWAPFILIGDID
ncbi:MAG: CHAT domain-containing tetratricopeptide repeat protein [Candidatus Hatepunaea meridiana]|nr:CHAT domain-containing tetratricopeptide repeat protein [Candidatus Hatepunaea meridiana]